MTRTGGTDGPRVGMRRLPDGGGPLQMDDVHDAGIDDLWSALPHPAHRALVARRGRGRPVTGRRAQRPVHQPLEKPRCHYRVRCTRSVDGDPFSRWG